MLKEINYKETYFDETVPSKKAALEAIKSAEERYGKITVKLKVTAKGEFIVIYAYDKSLYRYVIVDTIELK